MTIHQPRSAAPFANRQRRWTPSAVRPESKSSQDAQRKYERYLALARAETQFGNIIGAENYYQYAEHYYRSMRPEEERTSKLAAGNLD
jgi:hypothetical protein